MSRRTLIAGAFCAALLWTACGWVPHQRLAERVLAAPSRVYGRPLVLAPGIRASRDAVAAHLERAGYRPTKAAEVGQGRFRLEPRRWRIGRRAFEYPDGAEPAGLIRIDVDAGGTVREVVGPDGAALDAVFLEPEPIGSLFGESDEDRVLVPMDQIPRHVVDAVLVTEDRRFHRHPGIDPIRIVGAARENLRGGRIRQGGSTLTQQLVKNVYLSPERTWARKLREVALAVFVELRYTKQEILEAYLNQVYLGQDGGRGIHGVGRAARFYFGKDVSELSVADAALLAAIIRAPSALSPFRHPDRAREQRDRVLDRLLEHGRIDGDTHHSAHSSPLGVRREPRPGRFAGHYLDLVRGRLEERFAGEDLERDGLRVFTTLDGSFQRAAEAAVRDEIRRLERGYPLLRRRSSPLQAALVALDPASGDVLALVGARDFEASPFDRATRARRQPGSLFKPVVALAALGADVSPPLTLASLLEDAPLTLQVEGKSWTPSNHDGRHRGPVSLRAALEDSLNVPFARLGLEVGLVPVADTARRMGVASPLRPIPSLTLGAFETTPLEIASVYAVLASGGVRTSPRTTLAVVRPGGRVLYGEPVRTQRAFGAAETYLVTEALRGAVVRGTAKSLPRLGVTGSWAGKTGTTNGFRDAWFVAYAPDLVVAVWVGFDDGARVGLSGAQAALPIVARFVRGAYGKQSPRQFPVPDGIQVARIDPGTGRGAGIDCPGHDEVFLAGTAPAARDCGSRPLQWALRALGQ
ncbi:MAG: PBP1A family penicillin-binding protein [Deltaproteobacteria bacterium]|nr:PBP1A family penicillin-binding protein [Deltaproteobacteria bacterium]